MSSCPHCQKSMNRKGKPFTPQGLAEHIRQCPYNPDYETYYERLKREYRESLEFPPEKIEIMLTESVSIYV